MKLITLIFIEFKLFQNNGLGRIAPDSTRLADPGQVIILSPSTWGF